MAQLDHDQVIALLVTLGTLLGTARLLGELAARLGQPSVVGELVGGVLLGPTVLGRLAPETFARLFPSEGPVALCLSGFMNLALVLFLLVAGLEIDFSAAVAARARGGLSRARRHRDFDAPDGKPVRAVFLLLTPAGDDSVQLELIADIARACREESARQRLASAASYTQLRALLLVP